VKKATHPPEERNPKQIKDLFFVLIVHLPSVKQVYSLLAAGASHFFYWGNLPMPQTPLDAHFY
jgi:hypothetical protein